jgi:hypothetical protein
MDLDLHRFLVLGREALFGTRDIAAHAHADPERPGAGRVGHPHDVSNNSTPSGLRVDRPRAQVDRAIESALQVGAGKPAGDAGRTGGVSEKATARRATHALYRPEIDLVLAANDVNPGFAGRTLRCWRSARNLPAPCVIWNRLRSARIG